MLGVSPFESFDKIKVAFTKKQKDAEKRGDDATLSRVGIYGLFLVLKIVNSHFNSLMKSRMECYNQRMCWHYSIYSLVFIHAPSTYMRRITV